MVLVAEAAERPLAAEARAGRGPQGPGRQRHSHSALRPGPDGGVPPLEPERFDFLDLLGAYDFHTYGENFDWLTKGQMVRFDKNTADWAAWAHQHDKAFFMSEFGTMANGWGGDHPGPGSYVRCSRTPNWWCGGSTPAWTASIAGVSSTAATLTASGSSSRRGTGRRRSCFRIHTASQHVLPFGLLPRFIAKHSAVLACKVEGGQIEHCQRVFAAALRSPGGNLTLAIVNDASTEFPLVLDVRGIPHSQVLYRYSVSEKERDRTDVRIDPQAEVPESRRPRH